MFEGGGAKGIAFSGALQAVREQHCWFSAVAGASAGAITAALVAAGLTVDEISSQAPQALRLLGEHLPKSGLRDRMRTTRAGLRRLRKGLGFFPTEELRDWLENCLDRQVRAYDVVPGEFFDRYDRPVTFIELFLATGIELNVVATDVSMGRQVVFDSLWTPQAAVSHAVMASAAIPGAFSPEPLFVKVRKSVDGGDDGGIYSHLIVDGGVWSNFPMFVFEDHGYSEWRKDQVTDTVNEGRMWVADALGKRSARSDGRLVPSDADPHRPHFDRVVGFVLDEKQSESAQDLEPEYGLARFDSGLPSAETPAREWVGHPSNTNNGVGSGTDDSIMGRVARWVGDVTHRGRWPTPENRLLRGILNLADNAAAVFQNRIFHTVGVTVFGLALVGLIYGIAPVNVLSRFDKSLDAGGYADEVVSLIIQIVFVVGVSMISLLVVIGLVLNPFISPTLRRLGYGIAHTYFAGPGAPAWVTYSHNVIGLPIPQRHRSAYTNGPHHNVI